MTLFLFSKRAMEKMIRVTGGQLRFGINIALGLLLINFISQNIGLFEQLFLRFVAVVLFIALFFLNISFQGIIRKLMSVKVKDLIGESPRKLR